MELSTSWKKAAEGSYTIPGDYPVEANTRLYLKYGDRDSSANTDVIYWEIRAAATSGSYGYGYDESYSLKDGNTTRASGSYREGSWPGDPVTTSERTLASGNWTQEHNSDGSWSTTLTFNGSVYGDSYSRSISVSLPNIPRYATVSTTTSQVTESSVKINWSSNANVDQVQYRLNNSGWVNAEVGVNKASGEYTISNLASGTYYKIDFDYKRKDSQQWSYEAGYSGSREITTLDYINYVKVDGNWKKAIPYIKVDGNWKKAIPYTKINGSWKVGIN